MVPLQEYLLQLQEKGSGNHLDDLTDLYGDLTIIESMVCDDLNVKDRAEHCAQIACESLQNSSLVKQ